MPTTIPSAVRRSAPSRWAMPKSPSAAVPSAASQTLSGLTSRCTTPLACACASAAAISRPMRSTSAERRPLARERGRQRAAAHRAQHEVGDAVVLADVVDGDDVRVIAEAPGDLRLALDAGAGALAARGADDDRQRDLAIQPLVVGEIDLLRRRRGRGGHERDSARRARRRRPSASTRGWANRLCRHPSEVSRSQRTAAQEPVGDEPPPSGFSRSLRTFALAVRPIGPYHPPAALHNEPSSGRPARPGTGEPIGPELLPARGRIATHRLSAVPEA